MGERGERWNGGVIVANSNDIINVTWKSTINVSYDYLTCNVRGLCRRGRFTSYHLLGARVLHNLANVQRRWSLTRWGNLTLLMRGNRMHLRLHKVQSHKHLANICWHESYPLAKSWSQGSLFWIRGWGEEDEARGAACTCHWAED